MFVLKADHEFDWPVTVRIPIDGGKYASQTFTARFRLPSKDEMTNMAAVLGDDAANARKVMVGWDGIVDEQKQPVPFSDEALDALLGVPWARVAIWQAFIDASFGIKRKNS